MQLHRCYWFLLTLLFCLHPLCAAEKNALFAPIDQQGMFQENQQNNWVELEDLICNQSVASINNTSSDDHLLYFDSITPVNVSEQRPFVIRGQSPSLLSGFSGRLRVDYLTDFDDTTRLGGHLFVNVKSNFGIDTEVNDWKRKLSAGGSEKIQTGDFNLIYSLTQNSRIRFRSGAGVSSVKLEAENDPLLGYNFTSAIDVFLPANFLFTGEMDWGKIESRELSHYRASIGYYLRPIELFIGYDIYRLDGIGKLSGYLIGGDIRF